MSDRVRAICQVPRLWNALMRKHGESLNFLFPALHDEELPHREGQKLTYQSLKEDHSLAFLRKETRASNNNVYCIQQQADSPNGESNLLCIITSPLNRMVLLLISFAREKKST